MPEILTESFCERCGTRYTFEAAAPKRGRVGKLKTLSKGLRNYVLSDETSLDEAFADARSEEQRALTGIQLDAFHKTFQFCMTCRQYTCANCWNETEGRCLSCAPHLGHEILPAPFPDLDPSVSLDPTDGQNGSHGPDLRLEPEAHLGIEASAWPTIDLRRELEAAVEAEAAAQAEVRTPAAPTAPVVGSEAPSEAAEAPSQAAEGPLEAAEAEQAAARLARAHASAELVRLADALSADDADRPAATPDDRAVRASARTGDLLARFRPGTDETPEPPAEAPAPAEDLGPTEPAQAVEPTTPPTDSTTIRPPGHPSIAPRSAAAMVPGPTPAESPEVEAAVPFGVESEASATPELRSEVEGDETGAAEETRTAEPIATQPPATQPDVAEVTVTAEEKLAPVESIVAEPGAETTAVVVAEAEPEAETTAPLVTEEVTAETPATTENLAPVGPPASPTQDPAEVPIWRIVAPETPLPPAVAPQSPLPARPAAPAVATAAPTSDTAPGPQWPAPDPQWPAAQVPIAPSLLSRTRDAGLWAASSQDVVGKPGVGTVQACHSCGLPLSATAQFCRRCGARQG
jgi:hypothetical protein